MNEKISYISKLLNLPEKIISLVLYTYMAETLHQCAINGTAKSIFGMLKLDDEYNLSLESTSNIETFENVDIKAILDLVTYGPDNPIFS